MGCGEDQGGAEEWRVSQEIRNPRLKKVELEDTVRWGKGTNTVRKG